MLIFRSIGLVAVLVLVGCSLTERSVPVSVQLDDEQGLETSTAQSATGDESVATGQEPVVDPPTPPLAEKTVKQVPRTVNWPVAFASQAPTGSWEPPYDEACEEASMIGAWHYYHQQSLDASIMDAKIKTATAWQAANGYQVDLSAAETVRVLRDHFGLRARVVSEVTVDRIKYELANNRLILAPVGGRLIDNPYFQTPGPIYHMLIIRGYDDRDFITNDPGTRRGEGFRYRQAQLIDAIHDWRHDLSVGGMTDEEIAQGAKVVVVVDGLVDEATAGGVLEAVDVATTGAAGVVED